MWEEEGYRARERVGDFLGGSYGSPHMWQCNAWGVRGGSSWCPPRGMGHGMGVSHTDSTCTYLKWNGSADLEFATGRPHFGTSFIIKAVPLRGRVFMVCVHGWPSLFWPLTLWLWGTWGAAQSANDHVNVWPETPAHKTCFSKQVVDVAVTHTTGFSTSPQAPESEPVGGGPGAQRFLI